jgi:hypothetical protein
MTLCSDKPQAQESFTCQTTVIPKVSEDFLREIYLHTIEHLKIKIGREIFDITPMDCWLTLPATWSDRAKAATTSAAEQAGFGSRAFDRLYTITEPEAAALVTLKEYEAGKGLYPIKVSYSPNIPFLCLYISCILTYAPPGRRQYNGL